MSYSFGLLITLCWSLLKIMFLDFLGFLRQVPGAVNGLGYAVFSFGWCQAIPFHTYCLPFFQRKDNKRRTIIFKSLTHCGLVRSRDLSRCVDEGLFLISEFLQDLFSLFSISVESLPTYFFNYRVRLLLCTLCSYMFVVRS